MKQEIAKKWASALRSGEYSQGIHMLRSKGGAHCALGVLCDLASKEGIGKWSSKDSSYFVSERPDDGQITEDDADLPTQVMEWSGMSTQEGFVSDEDTIQDMNDSGFSFSHIAELIEEFWSDL